MSLPHSRCEAVGESLVTTDIVYVLPFMNCDVVIGEEVVGWEVGASVYAVSVEMKR